ncbi:DUF3560 domain-containing protein [Streptomyces sp. NPDC057746]|uniref:DUF3560 domain-containing protein n=1 Tax=Streptomyces sp. NPDC057746 TaxID=3346237 RepID=UPI0036C69F32
MADIEITHTRAEGTLVDGSSRGDGVLGLMNPYGFRYSRTIGCIYLRHSRDRAAKTWHIEQARKALEEAGHTVTVTINESVRRSFEEAEEERYERAGERAEYFAGESARLQASSDAKWEAGREIGLVLQGEPIKIGHHSERRHRRALERADNLARKAVEEQKDANYASGRAVASEHYEAHRKNPGTTLRRLERLRTDLRKQERYHSEGIKKGWDVERHAVNIVDLTEEIAYREKVIEKAKADGVKVWEPADFVPGDFVVYIGSWHEVKRVNPKTLSIAWNLRTHERVVTLEAATQYGMVGTHSADYSKVQGRCPGEAMRAFLADGKVPGLKAAREASDAAPAEAIREAQTAKPKRRSNPKVPARVKVECRWDATEATVTWLNGRSQPHKDHPPVTISAPDGVKFTEAVWSRALLSQVSELLAERGYAYRGRWTGSPSRGIVCALEPAPVREDGGEQETAPDEPQQGEASTPDEQLSLL